MAGKVQMDILLRALNSAMIREDKFGQKGQREEKGLDGASKILKSRITKLMQTQPGAPGLNRF